MLIDTLAFVTLLRAHGRTQCHPVVVATAVANLATARSNAISELCTSLWGPETSAIMHAICEIGTGILAGQPRNTINAVSTNSKMLSPRFLVRALITCVDVFLYLFFISFFFVYFCRCSPITLFAHSHLKVLGIFPYCWSKYRYDPYTLTLLPQRVC